MLLLPLADWSFKLSVIVQFIVANYFLECFSICSVAKSDGINIGIADTSPIMVISSFPTSENSSDRIELGINMGCKVSLRINPLRFVKLLMQLYYLQCWILEKSIIHPFMDMYDHITTTTGVQRPIRPKFLIYEGFPELSSQSELYEGISAILNHPLMKSSSHPPLTIKFGI